MNEPSTRVAMGSRQQRKKPFVEPIAVSKARRHILFLNVGDERILEATTALARNTPPPPWTRYISGLSSQNGKLHHSEKGQALPLACGDQKRRAVKELYFDPKEPSTIVPITEALRRKFANISRSNVRNILRSLEVYQLTFARRLPKKIEHHTLYTKPGVIAMDTWFPSAGSGWVSRKGGCLTCMDIWSRFSRCYPLERKNAEHFRKAMKMFLTEFTSLGHLPRRLLTDKGSELHVGTGLIEKYRLPRDGDKPMHLRSVTGGPVLVVENMNAQYQRRAEPYRVSNLVDDHADILWDISEQLNNQTRKNRGNLTPYQLLALADKEQKKINKLYKDNYFSPGPSHSLPPLENGAHVRKLEMTAKEQLTGKIKGFQAKWSKDTYQVLRRASLRRNPGVYRYSIGLQQTYFRHELLLIPRVVDTKVLRIPTENRLLVADTWRP